MIGKTINDMAVVVNPKLFIKWYMKLLKARGLTSFWGTIYFSSLEDLKDEALIRHEMKHVEQMEREGIIKFLIKYNYYWIKVGYWNNPYEIEAREAE